MPYKDPEKKKQWEREHRKGSAHRVWWGYLYPESAPEDWETRIRESGHECVWALHDKDVTATGETKKAHVHVAVRFAHAQDAAAAKEALGGFGVLEASVQWRDSWRAVCRYLTHMDDPDKYQYSPDIVGECGGADWRTEIYRASDKYEIIAAMQDWCDDPANVKPNGCPPQFNDLMRYARANNKEWFMALCDNCAIVMREYCKGNRHDWRDEQYRVYAHGGTVYSDAYADNPDEWREVDGGAGKEPEAGSMEQSATTGAQPSFADCGVDAAVERQDQTGVRVDGRSAPSTVSMPESSGEGDSGMESCGGEADPQGSAYYVSPAWSPDPRPRPERGCLRGAQPPSFGGSRRGV